MGMYDDQEYREEVTNISLLEKADDKDAEKGPHQSGVCRVAEGAYRLDEVCRIATGNQNTAYIDDAENGAAQRHKPACACLRKCAQNRWQDRGKGGARE